MQQVVGTCCVGRGFRIAAAESCTGGLLMAMLTDVPGSSDYVDARVVVYSNRAKTDLLGVPHRSSPRMARSARPVAEAMAGAMARVARSRFCCRHHRRSGSWWRHTGEASVGMVAIAAAWARNGGIETRGAYVQFRGRPRDDQIQASQAALDMVRRWMTE